MVRECNPPAREPTRSWLSRRSTIATSTPANASSPANIIPVGPPPAITTAWSLIAMLRSFSPPRSTRTFLSRPRRLWLRSAVLRDEPGLEASPGRATYKAGRNGVFSGRRHRAVCLMQMPQLVGIAHHVDRGDPAVLDVERRRLQLAIGLQRHE